MNFFEIICLFWPLAGAAIYIVKCNRKKTFYATPIWQYPGTYLMFLPAMAAGPLVWFAFLE